MHPRNEIRLLAGLPIDHSLEVSIQEAREVPNRKDVTPATEKNLTKKQKDLAKAAQHLENAVKALEAAPATDTNAEIPQIIKDIEELIADVNVVLDKTAKIKPLKEGEAVSEMDISFDTSGADDGQTVVDAEPEADEAPASTSDFTEGDVVLFDNGIWVVYKHDKEANKVGIIPPDLHGKESEECAKAMQMVDPGKVRRPNNAESSILASGADNKLGTEDDIRMESAHTCPDCGCKAGEHKKDCDCKTCHKEEECEDTMNESTLNFTPSNAMSWKEVNQNPANSVAQGEDNWKTEPRTERPYQAAQNSDRNKDVVKTIKVPAKIRSSLKKAAGEFEAEAKRQGSGATAEENRQFYSDAAQAFTDLHDMLDGSFEGMQKAQIFASTLMGPMLHKLPKEVWQFISNGGQSRGLKDYMIRK